MANHPELNPFSLHTPLIQQRSGALTYFSSACFTHSQGCGAHSQATSPPARVKQQHTASHSEGIGLTQLEDRNSNKRPCEPQPSQKYRKCLHSKFSSSRFGGSIMTSKADRTFFPFLSVPVVCGLVMPAGHV